MGGLSVVDVDAFIARNAITPELHQRLVGANFQLPPGWEHDQGSLIQAPLSWKDHFVISHRGDETAHGQGHNLCYRPPGQHHHIGRYSTAKAAFEAADTFPILPNS